MRPSPSAARRLVVGAFAAFVTITMSAPVWAGSLLLGNLNVGSITVDRYQRFNDGTLGGVDFIAHYDLNANWSMQTCCSDLRWLQRVTSSTDTGFTPSPNRPFIDPRMGQNIGGPTPDNLPFYEFTGPNINNSGTRDGSGRYIFDSPRVLLSRATPGMDYMFCAESLVVCNAGNMMLGILGGISWGFTISTTDNMNYTVTRKAVEMLTDSQALRDSFNTALMLDYPGWTIKDPATLWPDLVPLPPASALGSTGLAAVVLTRRRRPAA